MEAILKPRPSSFGRIEHLCKDSAAGTKYSSMSFIVIPSGVVELVGKADKRVSERWTADC